MSVSSSTKVVLITGTSSGIGLSAAIQFAQHGFTVVATMRELTKAGPLQTEAREKEVNLDIRALDVQDEISIHDCVQSVLQTYGHIDVLVNNAGAGYLGTMEMTPQEDLRRVMEVNFFGAWNVTRAVFPVMRVARSGRIITVTSIGGLLGQPFNDAYCAAKFALEGFMESLAPVAKQLGIALSLIEPGPVNTQFVSSVFATLPTPSAEIEAIYRPMLEAYSSGTQEVFAQFGQTPEQVAQVVVKAALDETPHFRYPTSETTQALIAHKYVDPSGDSIVSLTGRRLSSR